MVVMQLIFLAVVRITLRLYRSEHDISEYLSHSESHKQNMPFAFWAPTSHNIKVTSLQCLAQSFIGWHERDFVLLVSTNGLNIQPQK